MLPIPRPVGRQRAIDSRAVRPSQSLRAAILSAALFAVVSVPVTGWAQVGSGGIPSVDYFRVLNIYIDGDYTDALKGFNDTLKSSIRIGNARWIDAICYYTMCGECYYQMGQLNNALDFYNSALEQWVATPDWMLRVTFPDIGPSSIARATAPWGQSRRNSRLGAYPSSMLYLFGNSQNAQMARNAGIMDPTMTQLSVDVQEIVRCTILAIRRRREILGPLAQNDQLTSRLAASVAKGIVPPRCWAEVWANLQFALIQESDGQSKVAADLLQRSLVALGEFDHPLTSTALLELGHLAMQAGDLGSAANLFEEASYSAYDFGDIGVIEEALRYGHLVHIMSGQQGPYPPLVRAMNWAKMKNYRQLYASLAIMTGESFAIMGQSTQAAGVLTEARSAIGRRAMASGEIGGRLNYVTALVNYEKGNVKAGDDSLNAAIDYKRNGSRWLFQLSRADQRATEGKAGTQRQAANIFDVLLRDPTPADWAFDPLDVITLLVTPHSGPYEHWFEIDMDRKDVEGALDIAERARRHRFYSSLPAGGRLLALRWILEAQPDLLDQTSRLQRQDLLTRYPAYAKASQQAQEARETLASKPLVPESPDAQRQQAELLSTLNKASLQQEAVLHEIGARREPSEFVFPPFVKTKDIRAALPEGHLILSFFATERKLYGFLLSNQRYASWEISNRPQLEKALTAFLRDLGNWDANHEMTLAELSAENWKNSSKDLYAALIGESEVNLGDAIQELIIVPDSVLWYLPFEALQVPQKDTKETATLLTQTRIRYAPTLGLAAPRRGTRRSGKDAAVVVGKLFPRDDAAVAQTAFDQYKRAVTDATALKAPLPGPSAIYRVQFDSLTVFDDVATGDKSAYDWTPVQLDRVKGANNSLSMWMTLPWGGPDYVILPGFHTPAETGLKKTSAGTPGIEMFLALCGLMSNGTDTILISRWRTGGQTSFDLVREFARELPNSTAADAWQRSVLLASDQVITPEQEPRVKRNATVAAPKAQHPFFWSGYLLVDTGAAPTASEKEPAKK